MPIQPIPDLKGSVNQKTDQAIRSLYASIQALQGQVTQLQNIKPVTHAELAQALDKTKITQALEAKGSNPINVSGLSGYLAQPQKAFIPKVTSLPILADPLSQDGTLIDYNGTLYRFNGSTSPGTWEPQNTSSPTPDHSLAYNSAIQSIPNSTPTALTFNVNLDDVGGLHSTSVNPTRFTAVKAGWYILTGQVSFSAGAGTVRSITVHLNGAPFNPLPTTQVPSSAVAMAVQVMAYVRLSANDYIEFMASQDSGGALNTLVNSSFGCLQMISL
jgi:hypothetical protein